MFDLLQMVRALGLPGALFVLFFLVAHFALIEFVKVLGTAIKRKFRRAEGDAPAPGSQEDPFIQGFAVMVLSLSLGAVLGGVMLGGIASLAGIELGRPWSGALLGVLLAAIVSGLVASRRKDARPDQTELLKEILAGVVAASTVPQSLPAPWPPAEPTAPTSAPFDLNTWPPAEVAGELQGPPAELPQDPDDQLVPITPAQVQALGLTGTVAVQAGEEVPLVWTGDGPWRPEGS